MDPVLSRPFWLSPYDATGLPRSGAMIDAARRVWARVLAYTKQALGETEPALEFLEKTVRCVERSQTKHEIRDLSAYIFRSYIRQIAAERRRRRRLLPLNSATHGPVRTETELEQRVLAQEALPMIRLDILPLVFRRIEGWTWDEIAAQFGQPKHALESRYSYEMRRVRNLLGTRKP
jgi:DNA-directed RNA polymerase specialized sigma24 family protein